MPTDQPSTIKVVDLFAGCGGFTAGFRAFKPAGIKRSPFESVAAVEFDQAAATTYAANFARENADKHVHPGDIKDFDPSYLANKVDVILGGPPCQGFSGLGKEDPEDPRNKLWQQYVRVVKTVRPKVFVIENVDRFRRSLEFELLTASMDPKRGALREYRFVEDVLLAADYGVPQKRRRTIVIATHRDLPQIPLPEPTHAKPGTGAVDLFGRRRLDWETIDGIFDGTPEKTATFDLPEGRRCNPLGLPKEIPGEYRTTELHIGRRPEPLSLARYRAIPAGGNRKDLRGKTMPGDPSVSLSTDSWDRHNSGTGDVMGRLRLGQPSVTIRTEFYKPEKGRYLHPTAHRPITHLEAALIQGFPLDFRWCGTKVQIARQIGNAVPVGLAKAIAASLYEGLSGR